MQDGYECNSKFTNGETDGPYRNKYNNKKGIFVGLEGPILHLKVEFFYFYPKECRDHFGNTKNPKIYNFYIEDVPQLFLQLDKIFLCRKKKSLFFFKTWIDFLVQKSA